MIGWVVRVIMVLAGLIASIFVAREALNFAVIQMVVAIVLFTLMVLVIAFWGELKRWFGRFFKK